MVDAVANPTHRRGKISRENDEVVYQKQYQALDI
jgi:hypothetical protein